MFNESIIKEALNHKCLNCPHIRLNNDFQTCYCDVTKGRIFFKRDVKTFCPLLAIACYELSAPCINFHNHKEVHVRLKDGSIYRVEEHDAIYNMDIKEYEYRGCFQFIAKQGCRSYSNMRTIKHSEIKCYVPDDEISELIKIK